MKMIKILGTKKQHLLIIQVQDEKINVSWAARPLGAILTDVLHGRLTEETPTCLIINAGKIANKVLKQPKTKFTNSEIKELTGLTLRQIQYYTTEEVVAPISKGSGRGQHHRYSQDNLFEFFIIRELWKYGITIEKIRSVMSQLIFAAEMMETTKRVLKK